MNGLHALVMQGKVLYLVCSDKCHFQLNSHRRKFSRVSDTPAWVVSKANTYARLMGKTPFVIFQGAWSILMRDLEREILPMARAEGKVVVSPCSHSPNRSNDRYGYCSIECPPCWKDQVRPLLICSILNKLKATGYEQDVVWAESHSRLPRSAVLKELPVVRQMKTQ